VVLVSETRRTSTTQRLAELRSAQPCDTTLQNLLSILNAKLDLSARLPVFEYEADSEGFQEVASFMSALASAERESVHEVLRSLRIHLDGTNGRFTPTGRASS
jgi:rubrerythrin